MKSSPLRPVGFVLLGLGVAAAGVGTYFGVTSAGQRKSVRDTQAAGGFDPVELYNRDQTAISNGAIANVLWAAGGALGVTGLIMVILGHDVAVVPGAGGGVTVLGTF